MSDRNALLLSTGLLLFAFAFVHIAMKAQWSRTKWVRQLFGGSEGYRKKLEENRYSQVREHALNVTPEMTGSSGIDPDHVFGAIMEWPLKGAVATVTGFENGDSSFFLSSGQIMIGGYAKPGINAAARRFVEIARVGSRAASRTENNERVPDGNMAFYLLTPRGRFRAVVEIQRIREADPVWTTIHDAAQDVITQWRHAESRDARILE